MEKRQRAPVRRRLGETTVEDLPALAEVRQVLMYHVRNAKARLDRARIDLQTIREGIRMRSLPGAEGHIAMRQALGAERQALGLYMQALERLMQGTARG